MRLNEEQQTATFAPNPPALPPTIESSKSSRDIYQVDQGHRSKHTSAKYRANFKQFLDYIKIYDLEVLLDLGKEAIQELVIKYAKSLRDNPDKKYSRATVDNRVAAILYFLDNNDIELNKRKIRKYYPSEETVRDSDRPYTIEEIQRMIAVCDLRTKAMILLMVSSGVRVGALHTMRIGHLTPIVFNGLKLYKIQVYAGTRDSYYTFCTPESYQAIQDYFECDRKRYGEEIKDKSPLFRRRFNEQDPFTINVPHFLTSEYSVMKAIDDCLKRSGVKTSEAMRTHAFRKFFVTQCESTPMKSVNVSLLAGHDIGVKGCYYKYMSKETEVLSDFMTNCADVLTIDPNHRLQQENEQLRKNQNDYLAELGDLRQEFNEMKQLLVHLNKDSQKQLVDEFYQKVGDKADIEWSCD